MKKTLVILTALALILVLASCSSKKENAVEEVSLESLPSQFYWTMGYQYAQMLGSYYADFDGNAFAMGMKDYVNGNERFDVQKQQEIYTKYTCGDNLELAESFLEKNKNEEGIQLTESGVQYKIISEGTGEMPSTSDTVNIDYTLTLLDGTVADSGKNVVFPLPNLIKGMIEGIASMKVGSVARLWIHPSLGYGSNTVGSIPGNSLLIFDVTLNEIVK